LANDERHEVARRLEVATKLVDTPLQRMEHALHPWVTIVVMPIFALANAGVTVSSDLSNQLLSPIALGVVIGLLVGKPVGIVGASWLAVRMETAQLPRGVRWSHLVGVGCLAGIGFTMSLFITDLAFAHDESSISAKLGILVASAIAGALGWGGLRWITAQ
jgi:NhaA family Na+:H+ antiporter